MKWKTKKRESSTKPKLQSLKRVIKVYKLLVRWIDEKEKKGKIKNGKGEMFEIEKSI